MKRRILLGLLVLVTLFTLTGCGESSEKEKKNDKINEKEVVTIQGEKFHLKTKTNLHDLHYNENYVDFHSDAIGNARTLSYVKNEELIFEIRLLYDDTRSLSELKAIIETQVGAKEQSKEVNGIKYIYYEYKTEDDATVHHYLYVHKGKPYSIGIFLGDDPGNIEEVFMNNISFE